MMHFHEGLRRRLADPDRRAYRATMVEAAATLDAIDLRHQVASISPALARDPNLPLLTQRLRKRHLAIHRLFDWLGVAALALLLLSALLHLG